MRMLIVDDEPLVRRSLAKVGKLKEHDVIEAENGLQGLEAWKREQPDLVFLDVLMPGLSGLEVLKEIQGQSQAKVVLMSAYSGEYDLERAKSMGADLFIPKPFEDILEIFEQAEGLVYGQ